MTFLILGLILILLSYKLNKLEEDINLEVYGKRYNPYSWNDDYITTIPACGFGLFITVIGINEIIKPYIPETLLHIIIIILSIISGRIIRHRVDYFAKDTFDLILGRLPEYVAYAIAVLNFFFIIL